LRINRTLTFEYFGGIVEKGRFPFREQVRLDLMLAANLGGGLIAADYATARAYRVRAVALTIEAGWPW